LLNINYRQTDFAMQHIKMMLVTNLHFSSMTQRSSMMETTCSSCWWVVSVFASHQRFCAVKTNLCVRYTNIAGPTRGVYKRYIVPGPVKCWGPRGWMNSR